MKGINMTFGPGAYRESNFSYLNNNGVCPIDRFLAELGVIDECKSNIIFCYLLT